MSFDWPFSRKPRDVRQQPEPNYTLVKDGEEIPVYVPLADEVKRVQTDFIQSVLALARASANTRRNLAEQTLIKVHGKAQ